MYEDSSVRAYYASFTATATYTRDRYLQPVFSLTVLPVYVQPDIQDEGVPVDVDPIMGVSAAATAGLAVRGVTPFVSAGVFTSDNVRGTDLFVSAGLARGF